METVYKNRNRYDKNISEEDKIALNKPNYLHKCTKCGEFKPNTDYTVNRCASGRKYHSACKKCMSDFYTKGVGKISTDKARRKGRKTNRITLIFHSAKNNAKSKGREFLISRENIVDLFEKQKGLCYYTNKPMYINIIDEANSNDSISIDRVDSSIGYTKDNIVLCRWIVNKIKNDLSLDYLLEIIRDINKIFPDEH